MPFNPSIIDELAAANANLSVDATTTPPAILAGIVRLYDRGNGSLTIRNASRLNDADLVNIARALNNRVTLVE